jgi:hypothetical protein
MKPSDYDYKRILCRLPGAERHTTISMTHLEYVQLIRLTRKNPRQLNVWLRQLAGELCALDDGKSNLSSAVRAKAFELATS